MQTASQVWHNIYPENRMKSITGTQSGKQAWGMLLILATSVAEAYCVKIFEIRHMLSSGVNT
jgi:hypothetical protein